MSMLDLILLSGALVVMAIVFITIRRTKQTHAKGALDCSKWTVYSEHQRNEFVREYNRCVVQQYDPLWTRLYNDNRRLISDIALFYGVDYTTMPVAVVKVVAQRLYEAIDAKYK